MSAATRVYLPLNMRQLRTLSAERYLSDGELEGFAVTVALVAALPSSEDEEGHEYAALQEAALAAAVRGGLVVLAADVDSAQVEEPGQADNVEDHGAAGEQMSQSPGRVVVREGVALRRVVSVQVLDPANERDPSADLELSWYDVTELAHLLEALEGA